MNSLQKLNSYFYKVYVPLNYFHFRARKQKRPKDPNAPKRALSGFFWFSNEHRGKIKDANPDFGVGDIAKVTF